MATPTTTPIDIQFIILRLQPEAQFQWTGDVLGLYSEVGEWRSLGIPQPTEAEVYAEWDVYLAEKAAREALELEDSSKVENAKTSARNIPNWATWDEATALAWFDDRLSAADIDGIASLAEAKPILKDMATVNRALIRMVLALRDHTWPDLGR